MFGDLIFDLRSAVLGAIAALCICAFLALIPRMVLRLIWKAVGTPWRLSIRLLRRLRILRTISRVTRPQRTAATQATSVIEQRAGHETELEAALRRPDDAETVGEVDKAAAPFNFAAARKRLQWERGLGGFRSFKVPASFFPESLTAPFTDEVSDSFLRSAQRFFNQPVSLAANQHALYEDVEGAFVVALFRSHDRECYFALNLYRKLINGNASRFVWVTIIAQMTLAILLVSSFMGVGPSDGSERIAAIAALGTGIIGPLGNAVAAAALFLASAALALVVSAFHRWGYAQQQRNNFRELTSFLARYLHRVSDRYREATTTASRVTVGDETDSKKLADQARKWHKIMMWLPFRAFFIENFVRNMFYQIHRNSTYYEWLGVGATAVFALFVGIGVLGLDFFGVLGEPWWLRAAGGAALILLSLWCFSAVETVIIKEELKQMEWLGFDDLNVSRQMDEVVGKYAEDVGFWKGRLDR